MSRPWVDLSERGQRFEAREGVPAVRPGANEHAARAKLAGHLAGLGAKRVPAEPSDSWEPSWCHELLNAVLRRRAKRLR